MGANTVALLPERAAPKLAPGPSPAPAQTAAEPAEDTVSAGRGKWRTYRAQVEESMLPGQPVSLLGPRRDEHGPGVDVNMLGQHLLGQESEGNHQSPEQEQRAGPQIHQSIWAPLAGEQEGPGSSRSSGLPVSAPRGAPASLPHWPPFSPRKHGDEPTTAGPEGSSRNRPSGTAARSAERWKSGQAPGCPSSNPGRAGSIRPSCGSGTG